MERDGRELLELIRGCEVTVGELKKVLDALDIPIPNLHHEETEQERADGDDAQVQEIRRLYQLLLTHVGYWGGDDVAAGLWERVRGYETRVLEQLETLPVACSRTDPHFAGDGTALHDSAVPLQRALLSRLFVEQLAVPAPEQQSQRLWQEFESWDAAEAAVQKKRIQTRTRRLWVAVSQQNEDWQTALAAGSSSQEDSSVLALAFGALLDRAMQSIVDGSVSPTPADALRCVALFERGIIYFPSDSDLWRLYADFIYSSIPIKYSTGSSTGSSTIVPFSSIYVLKRAVNRLPQCADLWADFFGEIHSAAAATPMFKKALRALPVGDYGSRYAVFEAYLACLLRYKSSIDPFLLDKTFARAYGAFRDSPYAQHMFFFELHAITHHTQMHDAELLYARLESQVQRFPSFKTSLSFWLAALSVLRPAPVLARKMHALAESLVAEGAEHLVQAWTCFERDFGTQNQYRDIRIRTWKTRRAACISHQRDALNQREYQQFAAASSSSSSLSSSSSSSSSSSLRDKRLAPERDLQQDRDPKRARTRISDAKATSDQSATDSSTTQQQRPLSDDLPFSETGTLPTAPASEEAVLTYITTFKISNLAPEVATAQLEELFGEVRTKSIRLLVDDPERHTNKGFAYMDVQGSKGAAAAVKKRGATLEGRPVSLQVACTALTTLTTRSGSFGDDTGLHSCIVRGLPRHVKEGALLKVLGQQDLVEIRIPRDEHGNNRGCAFVDYSSETALGRAMLKHGADFHGRKLRVEEKERRPCKNNEDKLE